MYENGMVNPHVKYARMKMTQRTFCVSTIRKDIITIYLKVQSTAMEVGKIITSDKL